MFLTEELSGGAHAV